MRCVAHQASSFQKAEMCLGLIAVELSLPREKMLLESAIFSWIAKSDGLDSFSPHRATSPAHSGSYTTRGQFLIFINVSATPQ